MTPIEVTWFKEGLMYAPSLVGALIIVAMFLRYLTEKEKRDSLDLDKRDKALELVTTRAFEAHEESIKVIRENTEVMGQVKLTLTQNTSTMEYVTRKLEELNRG